MHPYPAATAVPPSPRRILARAAAALPLLTACSDRLDPAAGAPTSPPRAAVVAGAGTTGTWSPTFRWPVVASHLMLMPNGKVLTWNSSDVPGDKPTFSIHVWDPTARTFSEHSHGTHNVFCSSHTFLPDGRLLVSGGHVSDDRGMKEADIFDYQTASWQGAPSMKYARWYPTSVALANGEVLTLGGTDSNAVQVNVPEVWTGAAWRVLDGAALEVPWYPWIFQAPNGQVFYAGPTPDSRYLSTGGTGAWSSHHWSGNGRRDNGSAVMYEPGKVLIAGGGDPPKNSVEVIDLNAGTGWRTVASMSQARRQFTLVSLPNGKVLALGGSAGPGYNDESSPVYATEEWDPATERWTQLAPAPTSRMYHSTALVLPDARVLFAGGGRCGTCMYDHYDAEIFTPPYLYNADGTEATRPTITTAPTSSIGYGARFELSTPQAASIAQVTLLRLPSVTHSIDMNQRYVKLEVRPKAGAAGVLEVTAPADANLAPPGHYMLFVVNGNGVPSVASIVHVGTIMAPAPGGSTPPPAPPAAANLTLGSGSDRLLLLVNQDAWNGDAEYTVAVDGVQIGERQSATALKSSGLTDSVTVLGDWTPGSHTVTVTFLNDGWGGSADKDRNLYVAGIAYNGVVQPGGTATLGQRGAVNLAFTEAAPPPAAKVTLGAGSDRLLLLVNQDAWDGSAQYTVSVNGVQIGGTQTASALRSSGLTDSVTVRGEWSAGSHTLTVNFLNDGWGGSADKDRNLHVAGIAYNGVVQPGGTAALGQSGPVNFAFTEPPPPKKVTLGAGSDRLLLLVNQDAWDGDAQYTVSVNGVQIGGTQTASALRSSGLTDSVTVLGDWVAGTHTLTVNFLNDGWGGSVDKDRNLHVAGVAYNGVAQPGGTAALGMSGPVNFTFTEPAPPPPITLTATVGAKSGSNYPVSLSWSPSDLGSVTVTRNGATIATRTGTTYVDSVPSGTYRYKVCRTGTTTCSNEVTRTF